MLSLRKGKERGILWLHFMERWLIRYNSDSTRNVDEEALRSSAPNPARQHKTDIIGHIRIRVGLITTESLTLNQRERETNKARQFDIICYPNISVRKINSLSVLNLFGSVAFGTITCAATDAALAKAVCSSFASRCGEKDVHECAVHAILMSRWQSFTQTRLTAAWPRKMCHWEMGERARAC